MLTEEQASEIRRWWDAFKESSRLTEIRILGGGKETWSGYYRDVESIIRDVAAYGSRGAVYFTVNDPVPACYEKAQRDTMLQSFRGELTTTTDKEIAGYRFVLLDIDCEHGATGVNSTDEEKELAHRKASDIYKFLISEGFNPPLVNDSANGYHLFIPCALSNSQENRDLVKRFTLAMGMMFSDERVKVDPVVANPARIAKLPGTYSNKGSAGSVYRPRRMCRVLLVPPGGVIPNDRAYFVKVAERYPEPEKPDRYNNFSTGGFDLDDFIARHNIPVTGKVEVADGTRYFLDHCLFDESHRGKDAVLFRHKSGAVSYFCYHASCAGNDWHRLREMYEPGCYDRKYGAVVPERRMLYRKDHPPTGPEPETPEKGAKWKRMSEIARTEINEADYIPSGIKQIDDLVIGFKRRQVTLWSGYRGSAKSTLLSQLILNAANRGYKSAVWTGELDDSEFKTWLYLQAAGKAHNRPSKYTQFWYTPKDIAAKIDPWIDKYLLLYNNEYNDNYDGLEGEIRAVYARENIDQVFIDNLTILDIDTLDENIYAAQKAFMKRIHYLARELNIHIHCVAHPNKSGGFLRQNNISGSGHLPDLAQNVAIIHRINRDFETSASEFLAKSTVAEITGSGCTNCIELCKWRDKGSAVDTFVKLWFEMESNRLKNDIAENTRYGWEDDAGMPLALPEVRPMSNEEIAAWYSEQPSENEDMPY